MSVTGFTAEEQEVIGEKPLLPRLIFVPLTVAGVSYLIYPWPVEHILLTAAAMVVTGYSLFCWGSCFHETAHQTLTKSRWVSIVFGRIFGTMMFVPYTTYRETHIRHHAYLNSPLDWEMWPYSDPKASLWFRRVFALFDMFAGSMTSPIIYGRIFFSRSSPLSAEVRRTILIEYLACLVYWCALLGVVVWLGAWRQLYFAWLGPLFISGGLQSGRKLTEHLGMASFDPLLGTRTVITRDIFTQFLRYVNFDIFVHGAHHRHPRLSHHKLAATMNEYAAADSEVKATVFSSYGMAMADMLPWLFINPGVGVNAGAQPPKFAVGEEVDNFVGDVTSEVLETGEPRKVDDGGRRWEVREETTLNDEERSAVGDAALANFEHYAAFSTDDVRLFFLKLYRGDRLIGLAPVTKSIKTPSSELLRSDAPWWMRTFVAPTARNTTYTIDTSLTGFAYSSPFRAVEHTDLAEVRERLVGHLMLKVDAEALWVSEPADQSAWTESLGMERFSILPMCHVSTAGSSDYEAYLSSLSKKRRKHAREALRTFESAGGTIEQIESPFEGAMAEALSACLAKSAAGAAYKTPWDSVANNPTAFCAQRQTAIVARVAGEIVAFMSFFAEKDVLLQCHGGLDYEVALQCKAYHCLMQDAVRLAIDGGFDRLSFGPLNNETKRRAAGELLPMTGSFWTRKALIRPLIRRSIIPNLKVYAGQAP